ncbi:MAG: phosphate-starvation-inducible PsiE family protein [Gammaproteobacteria bacterium]|nr:phosphate-starvation-inducible PsiE family protein [Gammaproteobacteria bacterium]MDH5735904.1 phosphate-starvation-inducible PsiE family protein [Gammaproteobacteria bacterium]
MKINSKRLLRTFDRTVDIVFSVILVFIILGITIGAIQLFESVWELLKFEGITGHYIDLITDVLTLYVLVELSRSLVEYFKTHRLRLTFIVDAAIVFVIREVLIALFKHELEPALLYALSIFLLVLGALRTAAVLVYQREQKLTGDNVVNTNK